MKHLRLLIRRLQCVAAGGHFSCAADAICTNWLLLPQRPRATSFHQIDLSFNRISRFSPIGNQQAADLLLIPVISKLPIYNQCRSVRQTHFLSSHLPVCLPLCLPSTLLRCLTYFGQGLFGNTERWPLQCKFVFVFAYLCEFQVCYFKHRGMGGGVGYQKCIGMQQVSQMTQFASVILVSQSNYLVFLSFFHRHTHTST